MKLGENSDGVVPLLSQLDWRAQEAVAQYGFNASHEGILQNSDAIGQLVALIGETKTKKLSLPSRCLETRWVGSNFCWAE